MNTPHPATLRADDRAKFRFLPMLFSHDYVRGEQHVFQYADRFLENYAGGEWVFVRLSTGGGFMQPGEDAWRFRNADNWSDVEVSAEAAGIIITAMVLNHRSWLYDRDGLTALCEHACRRHDQLMAFAVEHAEAAAIFRALD